MFEDVPEGCPMQISSVVQNRGSIPLFWSQETSRLNLKPDIICMYVNASCVLLDFPCISKTNLFSLPVSRKDQNYEATRLHFENLAKRYGNPVIILNLIKVWFYNFQMVYRNHYCYSCVFFFFIICKDVMNPNVWNVIHILRFIVIDL